jgi:hypothetical protein
MLSFAKKRKTMPVTTSTVLVTPSVPSTGAIALSQIAAAFPGRGGALSRYYDAHPSLPASGFIRFSSFVGLAAIVPTVSGIDALAAPVVSGQMQLLSSGIIEGTISASTPTVSGSFDLVNFLNDKNLKRHGGSVTVTCANLQPGFSIVSLSIISISTSATTANTGTAEMEFRITNAYGNYSNFTLYAKLGVMPKWSLPDGPIDAGGSFVGVSSSSSGVLTLTGSFISTYLATVSIDLRQYVAAGSGDAALLHFFSDPPGSGIQQYACSMSHGVLSLSSRGAPENFDGTADAFSLSGAFRVIVKNHWGNDASITVNVSLTAAALRSPIQLETFTTQNLSGNPQPPVPINIRAGLFSRRVDRFDRARPSGRSRGV